MGGGGDKIPFLFDNQIYYLKKGKKVKHKLRDGK